MPLPSLRNIAGRTPALLDGVAAIGKNFVTEWLELRHGLAEGSVDEWNPAYIRRAINVMGPIFNTYFRGEVRGLEKIPDEGPVLIVGNHSGGLMIADTFVFTMAFYEHFGTERRFHQLAHDVAAMMPGLGVRPFGTVRASHENAIKAFERGSAVLVYPGGDYETFRPSTQSDQVDFGGRQGFIRLALQANVPIVPVVAMGGQETALFLTRGETAAKATRFDKLTRIKVLPVALGPPFGISVMDLPFRLPLPAKITIEVLEPIDLNRRFGLEPDPDEVYEAVTGDMQEVLSGLAEERTAPVIG